MGGGQSLLEDYHLLLDPELGSPQRWGKYTSVQTSKARADVRALQFQQQVPGNVIPMQAFINQMADTTLDGEPAISAKVISYWQGFAEMSKTLGMFTAGYFADRFGRKYIVHFKK
jgi:hypothetical protein